MDGKMKGMIMAGMAGLCLILGIMAALGNTWLVPEEEMEGMDGGTSLNSQWVELDTADMGASSESECDMMADMMAGDNGGEAECDGTVLTMTMPFSDACDDGDDDSCDMATGGLIGTIGMWAGIVCALMVTLTLVLPMAGVDAMDAVPEMGNKIATWGAGALMLVGMLGWYFMLPDGGEMSLGMSGWMAGAAWSTGLGSALIGQFIEADE
jgi:hypothetical protein